LGKITLAQFLWEKLSYVNVKAYATAPTPTTTTSSAYNTRIYGTKHLRSAQVTDAASSG
jgi:hypothetical protein